MDNAGIEAPRPVNSHIFARDENEHYVENAWVFRRFFEEMVRDDALRGGPVLDPCAGFGNVVAGAKAAGVSAVGCDLVDRNAQRINPDVHITSGIDFFAADQLDGLYPFENIVSNPPYGLFGQNADGSRIKVAGHPRMEDAFIELALQRANNIVAVFLRTVWANSSARSRWLETLPWWREYKVTPRPSCPPGFKYAEYQETGKEGSGDTKDYSIFVFKRGYDGDPSIKYLRRST